MASFIIKFWLIIILSLSCGMNYLQGMLRLYPSEIAQICAGQRFELTCSTNETGLMWTLDDTRNQLSIDQSEYFIFSSDQISVMRSLQVDFSTLVFARNSTQDNLPLVSTLIVINASTSINGTKVNCTEVIHNNTLTTKGQMKSTTFRITGGTHTGDLSTPYVTINTPQFDNSKVLVSLKWIPEDGVSYEVTSIQAVGIRFIKRSIVQLMVLYNTPYNISVVATKCGRDQARVTTTIDLNYAKCDYPLRQLRDDDTITVTGYVDPALQGTTISFNCSSGLILNTSICTENGKWEPDPMHLNCLEAISNQDPSTSYIPHPSIQPEIKVTFFCQESCFNEIQCPLEPHTAVCNPSGTWEPSPTEFCSRNENQLTNGNNIVTITVTSSISALLVSSLIIFIIGFVCGWYSSGRPRKKSSSNVKSDKSVLQETSPIYEDALPKTTLKFNKEIELDKNVAYGPIKP